MRLRDVLQHVDQRPVGRVAVADVAPHTCGLLDFVELLKRYVESAHS